MDENRFLSTGFEWIREKNYSLLLSILIISKIWKEVEFLSIMIFIQTILIALYPILSLLRLFYSISLSVSLSLSLSHSIYLYISLSLSLSISLIFYFILSPSFPLFPMYMYILATAPLASVFEKVKIGAIWILP